MLLLTSFMTLTSQLLNLSVLICQMGTMVLTSRVELRDANEKIHTECLVISGSEEVFRQGGLLLLLWLLLLFLFPRSSPTYQGRLAAEDSSLCMGGENIRPPGGLIYSPPLELPTTEPQKVFLGSNRNNDAGTLFACCAMCFICIVSFNFSQTILSLVLPSSLY